MVVENLPVTALPPRIYHYFGVALGFLERMKRAHGPRQPHRARNQWLPCNAPGCQPCERFCKLRLFERRKPKFC